MFCYRSLTTRSTGIAEPVAAFLHRTVMRKRTGDYGPLLQAGNTLAGYLLTPDVFRWNSALTHTLVVNVCNAVAWSGNAMPPQHCWLGLTDGIIMVLVRR